MSFFFLQNVFLIFQKTVFDHPSLLFPIFRFTKSQLFSLTTIFVIRNEKKSKGADSLPMVRAHRNVTELVQRAQTSTTSSEQSPTSNCFALGDAMFRVRYFRGQDNMRSWFGSKRDSAA